jgi:hypothetical protein
MSDEDRFRFRKYSPSYGSNFLIAYSDEFVLSGEDGFEFDSLCRSFESLDRRLLRYMGNVFQGGFEPVDIEDNGDVSRRFICPDYYMLNMIVPEVKPYSAFVEFVDEYPDVLCKVGMNMSIFYDIDLYRKRRESAEDFVVNSFNEYVCGLWNIYGNCFNYNLLEHDDFVCNKNLVQRSMLDDMEKKPGIYLVSNRSDGAVHFDSGIPKRRLEGGPKIYYFKR